MIKKNKIKLSSEHKKLITQSYLDWVTLEKMANMYWYQKKVIQKYLYAPSFLKNIVNEKWEKERKCSMCGTYRTLDNYYKMPNWYLKAHCNFCQKRLRKNHYIMDKAKWKLEDHKEKNLKHWHKHSWRYNTRRRILKILWVIDWNWRVIKK